MTQRNWTARLHALLGALLGAAILAGALAPAPALAAAPPAPYWMLTSLSAPTNLPLQGEGQIVVTAVNLGQEKVGSTTAPITFTDTLPAGLEATGAELLRSRSSTLVNLGSGPCSSTPGNPLIVCTAPLAFPLKSYESLALNITVKVNLPAASEPVNEATIEGGGAPAASLSRPLRVNGEPTSFGVEQFGLRPENADGSLDTQAGSHPFQLTTTINLNEILEQGVAGSNEKLERSAPGSSLDRNLSFKLPPGLVGNANVNLAEANPAGQCPVLGRECLSATAVGVATVTAREPINTKTATQVVPVFNLKPARGEPARFGFMVVGVPVTLDTSVRTGEGYGVTVGVQNNTESVQLLSSVVTFWGVPGDPRHDNARGWECLAEGWWVKEEASSRPCAPNDPAQPRPLLRLPTSCGPQETIVEGEAWDGSPLVGLLGERLTPSEAPLALSGCESLPFAPTLEALPSTNVADSPSGLHVDLHIPQPETAEGLAEADLKDVKVVLPKGLAVDPSSANGLQACTSAQIELNGPEPANCPDASKIGSVEVDTPLIGHPLPGAVYLAKQGDNPFHSLLAIYVAVNDPESGVVVKLAGHVEPDPTTGQLTTTFAENPQLPFEDFKLDFFNGARAPLRTPPTCGTFATSSELTPWSAPESGPPASSTSGFEIASSPSGGSCPKQAAEEPNSPAFEAGTESPIAGTYSPFVLHLRREDGSQELQGLDVTLPPGLSGRLAGTPYCPDADIAAAEGTTGTAQLATPSCPAASEVGSVEVGSGPGPNPVYVHGKAYLAGPYKGAPLSLAIITPAVAGPFDLGTVAVRAALQVNPETAQVTTVSDPIPTILQGIPLDVRSIAVSINRPEFTLNPTSCEAMAVTGTATSVLGQAAALSNRFQVGGCESLGFKPKLKLKLKGGTKRSKTPALTATLTMPPGGANVARAQVALPHSEFLDQAHIKTICTRVQFAAGPGHGAECPAGSIYGRAKAWTPLLAAPLEGPVYLRSSSHKLPDLVAALNGQIDVDLDGRIDSVHGGIRNSFEAVPDAPVSKFVLEMQGGKKGLLENSRNLCKSTSRATVDFTAQNGKVSDTRPPVQNSCKAKKHAKKH